MHSKTPWRSGALRKVVFMLVPLVVLLLGGEVLLRLAGYEVPPPDREVSWCREHSLYQAPFFVPLPLDGHPEAYMAPALAGHPRPFPLHKLEGQRRVFVLGGSAAHGYGFSRNGSFAGRLQPMLAQAYPGWEIQVVNAGSIAWSSQQVLQVGKDVLEHLQPDLLVVYSGNNELLEWWDWRQFLPRSAHHLLVWNLRWSRRLGQSALYAWMRQRVLGLDPHRWGQTGFSDDEALPWGQRARLGGSDRAYARETFRYNIRRLLQEARAVGVPVVLSTVAANWMDPPGEFPFAGEGMDEPSANLRLLDAADKALVAGRPQEAEGLFRRAWRAWPEAITHWRWGDLYRRHGHVQLAREHLRQAIRLDENPHRVLPEVNQAIRELAVDAGVPLLDGEVVVASLSRDGIIGFEEVYDHCHPTLQAHLALAAALAEVVTTRIWPVAAPDFQLRAHELTALLHTRGEDSQRVERWLGVDLERGQADYIRDPEAEIQQRWRRARRRARRSQRAADWNLAGVLAYHGFHADCPRGRSPCLQHALDAFRRALEIQPDLCVARSNLAQLYQDVGWRTEGAEERRRAAVCVGRAPD